MSRTVLFISVVLCFCSCTETVGKKEAEQGVKTESAPPIEAPNVGGDRDSHSCIASAGYQWSEVRKECIRIFEKGIRLNAKGVGMDTTFSAFAVFKSDTEKQQAELFLVNIKNTPILNRVGDEKSQIWKNADYTLTQNKNTFSLEDSKKTLLYQGMMK